MSTTERQRLGRMGEDAVMLRYANAGYTPVARNVRQIPNEIDLILESDTHLVFVEVKTRASLAFGSPKEAATRQKQARYYKIAQYYGLQSGEEPNARFDVIEVFEDGEIVHIENAF